MPNKHNKAGHTAQRTCVVCRQKSAQKELMSFFFLDGSLVFDLSCHIQRRKMYLCGDAACAERFPRWKAGYAKKNAARAGKGARHESVAR